MKTSWSWYVLACVAVFVAAVGTTLVLPWLTPSISLLFFPAIVVTALYGGYGPALLATVLSTGVLAYFFVPPVRSFNVGVDDALRLSAFATVALITASISLRRTRAEQALRHSLAEMQAVLDTMQRVRDWPRERRSSIDDAAGALVQKAAEALDCGTVLIVWTDPNSPRAGIAESAATGAILISHPREAIEPIVTASLAADSFLAAPDEGDAGRVQVTTRGGVNAWPRAPIHPTLQQLVGAGAFGSAPFTTEHLSGRVFFYGLSVFGLSALARVEIVAKEIGASLERAVQ